MIETPTCLLIANSLYIYGLSAASDFEYVSEDDPEQGVIEKSKMILWKFRWLSLKYLGAYLSKMTFTCSVCMSSLHSSYIFWPVMLYLYGFNPIFIFLYPVYVGVLAGVNHVSGKILSAVEAGEQYLNNH